jgi:hypothetical protein
MNDSEESVHKLCANPKCKEPLIDDMRVICPACLLMGRRGVLAGGIIVGVVVAILKSFGWI